MSVCKGNDANILELSDKIEAFVKTISQWRFYVSDNSGHEYFPFLNHMLADLSIIFLSLVVSNTASEHLSALEANSKQYFTSDFSSYAWIRNPFSVNVVPSMFYGPQKEEFIDLSGNNTLKSKMDKFCTDFWIEACTEYPCYIESSSPSFDFLCHFLHERSWFFSSGSYKNKISLKVGC